MKDNNENNMSINNSVLNESSYPLTDKKASHTKRSSAFELLLESHKEKDKTQNLNNSSNANLLKERSFSGSIDEIMSKNKEEDLKEKIEKLNSELKKTKEEKTNIIFKNGLTEKKVLKLNNDIDKLKKMLDQKDADIEELNEKIDDIKLKNSDLENQKANLQNKIFSYMSKINDLSANYENLQKEKETEITDYKEYLNEKEEVLDELRLKNKQSLEKVSSLEKDKNRVSSVGNKQKISLNLKNNNINNINKSWNKNKYCFLNIAQKPIKIQIKNTMNNFNNTSYIKNLQNLLSQKNINIDLKRTNKL